MNLLRYFEDHEIKDARRITEDLKRLVEMAKGEQLAAEERLRTKTQETKELNRLPIASALSWHGWRGND